MEYVVCYTWITIASTGPHKMLDIGWNRGVGGGWRKSVGRFGGGSDIVFEVLGVVRVSLLGFEVDGDLKFG